MTHLLLGINIIFPIFFVLFAGYAAKEKGFLDDAFVKKATWLVFYIALPFKLFNDMRTADIHTLHLPYVIYILSGICIIFFGTWFFARLFIKDRKQLSAFVHCAYRSNFVYVGFPILDALFGTPSAEHVMIVTAFGLTLYNILAIFILTYYGEDSGARIDPAAVAIKVLKNPMIVGILAGLAFNFLHIPIYGGITDGMELLARLSTPLSLILIGASLDFSSLKDDLPLILAAAGIKNIVVPLLLIPLGIAMGMGKVELGIAYVFWATPCAVNCFIFTREMGSDYRLASKIITASFLLAIVTYPVGIAWMKAAGLL